MATTSSPSLNKVDSENSCTGNFLKEVGLDKYPIDPSSLSALNEIVSNVVSNNELELVFERLDKSNTAQKYCTDNPPIKQITTVKNEVFQRLLSDVSDWNPTNASGTRGTFDENNVDTTMQGSCDSVGGSTPLQFHLRENTDTVSSTQQMILDQLEQQTRMLLLLHERMDQLTTTVTRLSEVVKQSDALPSQRIQTPILWRQNQPISTTFVPPPPVPMVPPHQQQQTQQQDPEHTPIEGREQREAPQMFIFALYNRTYQFLQSLPQIVRDSKYGKIARLFVALHARQVRNFDVGLAIKVLFMIAIFMTRFRRRLNPTSVKSESFLFFYSWSYTAKFVVVTFFVLTGFLVQNGFFKFLYSFFIKNNYAGRIMDGEDLEVERVLEEETVQRVQAAIGQNNNRNNNAGNNNNNDRGRPQQQGNAAAGGQANPPAPVFNLRQTLLGGGIAPIENNNNPQGQHMQPLLLILRILQDILIFVGSFFLSIFPMWRPVAAARAQQVPPQPEAEQPQPQEPVDRNGIPNVRPPVDPAEYDENDM